MTNPLLRAFAGHSVWTISQQALALVTGLVIVRNLEKADYAHYVLAFGMVSAIGILAEAGIVSTLLRATAAREDPQSKAMVTSHAIYFRRRTTVLACIVVLPVAAFLLHRSYAGTTTICLLIALIAVGSLALGASQMSVALVRLNLEFGRAGKILLASAWLRLLLTAAVVFIPETMAAVWLMAVLLATSVLEVIWLHVLFRGGPPSQVADDSLIAEFRLNARRVIPNNAFYLIQGQLVIWALAVLGSVDTLAEMAAMSRLTLLFGLASLVISSFAMSLAARASSGTQIVKLFGASVAAFVAVSCVIFLAFWQLPDIFLGILGEGYQGLSSELLLVSVGSFISGLTGAIAGVSRGRAWLKWAWIYLPMTAAWLALLATSVGVSNLWRAALFWALAPMTGLVSELVMATTGYIREFRGIRSADASST